jgi:hypothetical protein
MPKRDISSSAQLTGRPGACQFAIVWIRFYRGWLTAQLTNRRVDARRLGLPRRIGEADIVSDVVSKTLTLVETQSSLFFLILLSESRFA